MARFYNETMRSWLAVLLVGCGSSVPIFPNDDIAQPFDGGGFDSTVPKDGSTFDVTGEDVAKFNGGGPFTCGDCTCDGTLNYCVEISGGKAPMLDGGVDAGDASTTCDPDASACTQIPIGCLPKPTCECVMQQYKPPCTCDIDPSGNGLVVRCLFP